MIAAFLGAVLVSWGLLGTASAARADQPNFGDLLAKAKAQSAAGHRLSPPGDNVAETVAVMMTLISTATPAQLEELADLLQPDRPPAKISRLEVPPATAMPRDAAPSAKPDDARTPRPAGESVPRGVALFARGQQAERNGDVSGARRYYASAAALGHAEAARAAGRLFDPAYLKQPAPGGLEPDPAQARVWYERAIQLGDAGSAPLLQALSSR